MINIEIKPTIMTVITTYQCTAACKDCCFECTPAITAKLSEQEIITAIQASITEYPDIQLVVFSGGECFMLKDALFNAIAFATSLGRRTRCVTNAYWAKSSSNAEKVAARLTQAGITEINISTGLDHQQWVPESAIVNAVTALHTAGIYTLVAVEKDTEESGCLSSITSQPMIARLLSSKDPLFRLVSNAWMPFHKDSNLREKIDQEELVKGCQQVFQNVVVTPHKQLSACCGLTFEHIPEMKLGSIDQIKNYRDQQQDDFLKLWLRVEGPYKILKDALGEDSPTVQLITHQCQACVILHKNEDAVRYLQDNFRQKIPDIYFKYKSSQLIHINGV